MPLVGDRKREYDRLWMRQRRAAYFKGKSCRKCGSEDDLELDHIDPATKLYKPSHLWSMSDKNQNKTNELAKCQVLCEECHGKKTADEAYQTKLIHPAGTCGKGHDLSLVGLYATPGKYNLQYKCKYCQRLKDRTRRGGHVPSIEEFVLEEN